MDKQLAKDLIQKMYLGWNLGNTLDAPQGETAWHNPKTTPEMIKKIHELGFKTLRIPISWHRHVDKDVNIEPKFIERVNEVVDYAYNEGMYVIINIHHDDVRFQPTRDGFEDGKHYIKRIWEQVAEHFKDYGERLIFEAMNEPRMIRHQYEWNLNLRDPLCLAALDYINEYNQLFVDLIRASGGFNPERFLMTPSYCAAPHHAFIPAFKIPSDPADKIVISVHSYSPIELCLMPNPDVREFNDRSEHELDGILQRLAKRFTENGVPVVIGEIGIWDKNNPEERYKWAKYFVGKAKELGMACVWWDNGGREFKLLDRRNCEVYDFCEPVMKGLLEGADRSIVLDA